MTDSNSNTITYTKCKFCGGEVNIKSIYCSDCKFPQNGSLEQKRIFRREFNQVSAAKEKVRHGSNLLIFLGIISFVAAFFYYTLRQDPMIALPNVVVGVIFIVLGFWSTSQPLLALSIATALYSITFLINIIAGSTPLFATVLKCVILLYLIHTVISARRVERERRKTSMEEEVLDNF